MQTAVGVVFVVLWLVYVGQLVSSVNFRLAQRLGLQEKAEEVDPLFSRLELGTARWDVLSLWTVPVAGVLMLMDHSWWPYLALIGGGVFVDAGGREAVKLLGLRGHGVRVGARSDFRLAMGVFTLLAMVGGIAIATALAEVV